MEGFRRELGHGGGNALAHFPAGGPDVHGTVFVHLYDAGGGGGGAGELIEAGDALAAEVALLVHPAVRQAVPADVFGGGPEAFIHRTGGDDLPGDAHIAVVETVVEPQGQGVHPQLPGDDVHLMLVEGGGLRDAEAPVSRAQGAVGHIDIGIHLGVGDLIGTVGGEARVVVHTGIGGDVSAGIPIAGDLLGGDGAVLLHAGLDVILDGGAADSGLKFLVAVIGQLYRAAAAFQGQGNGDGLTLGLIFAAEAAADLRQGQAHLFRRNAEDFAHEAADAEGGLVGSPYLDLLGKGIGGGGGGVGLHQSML